MAKLNPYVSFKTEAREALAFYQAILGGVVDISTFSSMPADSGMPVDPQDADLVMHGLLETPGGLTLMAADTGSVIPHVAATSGMSVALTGGPGDLDYIRTAYEKLCEDGSPGVPFALAPWGDYYGHLTDKFGVTWMFDVAIDDV